jgi:hypothetical protein
VTVGGSAATAALSIGCTPSALQGKGKLRALKRRNVVAASWKDCGGLSGRIRLSATITDDCATLSGTLRAKGFKKKLSAVRSECGDGVLDADGGEACEPGAVACAENRECRDDCSCATGTCNPLTQEGCAPGNKCTWIQVADSPEPLGQIGCVAAGTVAAGGACVQGAAGETTGFDDCQAGLVCISARCDDICGFDESPGAACAEGYQCSRYAGLFANGSDDPVAGACVLSCDPVTQLRGDDTPCPGSQGCYLLTSSTDTIAVCAGAGTLAHGQEIVGPAYANSCLPGHMPRRRDQVSTVNECGALCRPADVYQGHDEASEGGVAPYTCESKGAAAPSDPTAGESCRYYWARESFETGSAFSNTVGWCFKHAAFQYDSNGDSTPDAPYPRCTTLTTGDVVPPIENPPHNDALYFQCVARSAAAAPPAGAASTRRRTRPSALLTDRLGDWR